MYHSETKGNIVSLWIYNIKPHFYTSCKCSKGLVFKVFSSQGLVWFGFFSGLVALYLTCKTGVNCYCSALDVSFVFYERDIPSR